MAIRFATAKECHSKRADRQHAALKTTDRARSVEPVCTRRFILRWFRKPLRKTIVAILPPNSAPSEVAPGLSHLIHLSRTPLDRVDIQKMASPNSNANYMMVMPPASESAQSSSALRPVSSTGAHNPQHAVPAPNSERRPSIVESKYVEKIPGFLERTASRFQSWKESRNETALRRSGRRAVSTITRGLATDDFKKVYQGLKRLHNGEQKLSNMDGKVGALDKESYFSDRLERVVSECLPDEKNSNDSEKATNLKKFAEDCNGLVDQYSDSKTLFHRMLLGLERFGLISSSYVGSRKQRIATQDNKIKASLQKMQDSLQEQILISSLKQQAGDGSSPAMYKLGVRYRDGRGVDENPEEAFKWFRKAADAENPDAMHALGRCYTLGEGVDKDPVVATQWYWKAARAGHAGAMHELGHLHALGKGVGKNPVVAVQWWKDAARAGHAGAMLELGRCYALGEGVKKDPVAATLWYRKAARAGNADAMLELGHRHALGEGVKKDPVAAAQWWRKAADAGKADAMYELGRCYALGEGLDKNLVAAVEWWKKAADAEHPDAMHALGRCYYRGEGVDKDLVAAADWWKKAADAGKADAMHKLGRCYYRGEGVKQNPVAAVQWWRKAAEAENTDAMHDLGHCYYYGEGVDEDRVVAAQWWNYAAHAGNIDARGALELHGLAVEVSKERPQL